MRGETWIEGQGKDYYRKWLISLLILLLTLVAVDVCLRVTKHSTQRLCLAIPMKFVLNEPECGEKLLRAANVSNVKIVSTGMLDSVTSRE